MIELKNVSKLYGNVIGVNDITVELPSGATDWWDRTVQEKQRSSIC